MRRYDLKLYQLLNKVADRRLVKRRRRQLDNDDFSIISNNCWGGFVYQRYGLPYSSPTVGLYFFANDFVKFCFNLKDYMAKPLEFIPYTESKYRIELERRKNTYFPVARLGDDVEILFQHYKTEEEAREKWIRRAARINYDNLIFKFSKQNLCDVEDLTAFDALDCRKKICFIPPEDLSRVKCGVAFKSYAGRPEVSNDIWEYARYINLTKMINSKSVCGLQMED